MRRITTEPLTAEAFAPFGEVLESPASPGRAYIDKMLENRRGGAKAAIDFLGRRGRETRLRARTKAERDIHPIAAREAACGIHQRADRRLIRFRVGEQGAHGWRLK